MPGVCILLLSCFLSLCCGTCLDTKNDCSTNAKNYDCLRVPEEMSCACPQSCNTLSECRDAQGDLHCECLTWVQEGKCDSNSEYMKEACHDTCTIWRRGTCPIPPSHSNMVVSIVRGSGRKYTDVISYTCDKEYTGTSGETAAQGMMVCDESYTWRAHGVYGDLPLCVNEDGAASSTVIASSFIQTIDATALMVAARDKTSIIVDAATASSTFSTTTTHGPLTAPTTTTSSTVSSTTINDVRTSRPATTTSTATAVISPVVFLKTNSRSSFTTSTTLNKTADAPSSSATTTPTLTTTTTTTTPSSSSSTTPTITTPTTTPTPISSGSTTPTLSSTTTFNTPTSPGSTTNSFLDSLALTTAPARTTTMTGICTPSPSDTTMSEDVLRLILLSSLNECMAINNSFRFMDTISVMVKMLITISDNNLLSCIEMCGKLSTCTDVQYTHGNCTLFTQKGGNQLITTAIWRKFSV